MPIPPERKTEEEPLTEAEAGEAYARLRLVTSGLLRVSKEELDQRLSEERIKSRRRRVNKS